MAASTSEDAATAPRPALLAYRVPFIEYGVPDDVRTVLKDKLLCTMSKYVLNNTHLEATVCGIVYDLSAPLLEYRNAPSEVCIREVVVLP